MERQEPMKPGYGQRTTAVEHDRAIAHLFLPLASTHLPIRSLDPSTLSPQPPALA
jgi:hypothetical protein